jgi:peptidoglycan-associated lipoprotein
MKLNNFATLATLGLALTLAGAGCHKSLEDNQKIPPGLTQQPTVPPGPGIDTNASAFGTSSTNDLGGVPLPPVESFTNMAENATIFEADTVHFAFDSSVVKKDDQPKAANVAEYLKGHAEDKVRIKGHCDERGTAGYNQALGERRALALRQVLLGMGIDPIRIDTISYGFEQPVDPAHNETAWAKNRRGEFVLLTPLPK